MGLVKKLETLPTGTGVYMMKDARSEVIYVGKAKNLNARVRTYFSKGGDGRALVAHLVRAVADIDIILTDTEKEALILENNLIKQFKPRYNVLLRDDKTYVSIRLDMRKKYPHPQIVRTVKKDGALYFGPYSSSRAVKETLRFIYELYPIRKCSERTFRGRSRPCLYYQMEKCMGPCIEDLADQKAYRDMIDEIIFFLRGKKQELVEALRDQMNTEAAEERYEDAAVTRDRIRAVEQTIEGQKIHSMSFADRDVFGFYHEGKDMQIQAMFIRRGNLEDLAGYGFTLDYNTPEEVFRAFLNQFYAQSRFMPKEVIIPVETEDAAALEELLSETAGHKVSVTCPQRGEKHRLVNLATRNAENAFRTRHETPERQQRVLSGLRKSLKLKNTPDRMECFDISNIMGKLAVGSMVTFDNALPNKNRYRRYKVETVSQSDDYAMIREVLTRRYKKAAPEDEGKDEEKDAKKDGKKGDAKEASAKDLPQLIIIDGGRGQLGVALKVMNELGITGVDVIALAKARKKYNREMDLQYELQDRVYVPGREDPVILSTDSAELLLLGRIRDEAHRFAITYHKKLRERMFYRSPLDAIPGIGPARKTKLMKCFGSIQNIREASLEDLKEIAGLPERQAEAIYNYFNAAATEM
ncbi:MAG: excinuclease ABC subunit UvrC [Planctomycetota bacterium]|jgi:excinuclease ABC subunit C